MKKLLLSLLLLSITFSYAQFEADWKMNLQNDHHIEIITLTKKGNTVTGTLIDGGKLNATYNDADNTLIGYFRYNKKMYKFNTFFKNSAKKEILVGKYCACSGTPTKHISFVKQKKYTNANWINEQAKQSGSDINMQGTWSSNFGELRLHHKGNNVSGDYKNVGSINGILKGKVLTGTFTNASKRGIFKWLIDGNKFTGKWAWEGNILAGEWKGTLKSDKKPILKNGKKTTVDKLKKINGKYRITVTNVYTQIHSGGVFNGRDDYAEIYGLIGIRLKGKSISSDVEIKSIGSKNPRVWNLTNGNAVRVKQSNYINNPIKLKDPTGVEFVGLAKIPIDRIREFNIEGDLANDKLMVNIQTNLKSIQLTSTDKFGWKQRNLYVKDMVFGKEYLLVINKGKDNLAVGFILDKF